MLCHGLVHRKEAHPTSLDSRNLCGSEVLRYLEIIWGEELKLQDQHGIMFVGILLVFVGYGKDHQPDHQPPLKHL